MTRLQTRLRTLLTATFTLLVAQAFLSHPALAAEANPREACESLLSLSSPQFRVDAARWMEAASQPAGPGGATTQLPEHCLFQVVLDPRESGIEGLSYGTGIELRLPLEWNGRLLFQGGGGLNGVLNPALGQVPGAASALNRGFAVVSTDGGHRGSSPLDVRFARDQQARLDFAYQAVARSTREAKSLIDQYYGRQPDYSYFMGCSTGGREAMLAAQRLPLEFDGVVAGNPAFNFTRLVANQIWSLQTVTRVAPKDDAGNPRLSEAFSDEQLQAVSSAVLGACDALDGLADGMINDFQACDFDPAVLQCSSEGTSNQHCMSSEQVTALQDIMGGIRTADGESLYGSTPYDTGIAGSAWRGMHLGSATSAPANASLGLNTFSMYALTPANPELDPLSVDFDQLPAAIRETESINDAVATLHSTFAEHGGKLIVYHGLSDQAMWAGPLIQWYENLLPRDSTGPQAWARLYMVPGMTHCGGGQSTDQFDMLTAIQRWVEDDHAPDSVRATGNAFPDVSRPLCPYPQVARYEGDNPDDAESFVCR